MRKAKDCYQLSFFACKMMGTGLQYTLPHIFIS